MSQGPEAHGHPEPEQARLKRIMKSELGGHTWQFPATEFIKMLSPRTLKESSSPMKNRSRSDFNYAVDESFFREALKTAVEKWKKSYNDELTCLEKGKRKPWPRHAHERQYNAPVAELMNIAFRICHDALNSTEGAPPRCERYHDKTVFLNYDRPTGDIMPGSAGALEPDVIGGNLDSDLENRAKRGRKREIKKRQKPAFWGPEKEQRNRIREVLELKALWPELVQQVATYARCLFHASPLRSFVVLFGFSHTQTRFRCLIFHRSGLTASIGYHPARDADEFLSIIMTMLLWTSPSHAGFDPTIDGTEFFLPTSKDDHMGAKWTDAECIYSAVVVRGRATRVHRLLPPNDPSRTLQGSTIQPSPFAAVSGLLKRSALLMTSNIAYELAESPGDSGDADGDDADDGDEDDDEDGDYKEDERKRGVPIVQQRREVTFHQPKSSSFLEEIDISKLPSSIVFKSQWVEDSHKDVEKTMYEDLASKRLDFGVGVLLATWEATYANGEAQSTAIFVPEPAEKQERHWRLFAKCPDSVEIRSAQCFILETVGRLIEQVTKSLDLFVILAHALLGELFFSFAVVIDSNLLGWLNVYQAGHLHRDISIGNVLEIIEPQNRTLPTIDLDRQFRAAAVELEGLGLDKIIGKVSAFDERLRELGRQSAMVSLEDQQENVHVVKTMVMGNVSTRDERLHCLRQQLDNATLLRETVDKVTSCIKNLEYQLKNNKHVDGHCRGFLIDGDMSKAWAYIFDNLEDKKVVGERSVSISFSLYITVNVSLGYTTIHVYRSSRQPGDPRPVSSVTGR